MATLLKVLNNLADIKSAGGVALRVRTQGPSPAISTKPSDVVSAARVASLTCGKKSAEGTDSIGTSTSGVIYWALTGRLSARCLGVVLISYVAQ
jgi:hypothetical protein